MDIEALCEVWRINNAINLEMLDACDEKLHFELKPGKGKTIRSNFVHMIGVRKMWMEEKMKKESALIPKLDWKTAKKSEIKKALQLSSEMMMELFRKYAAAKKPDADMKTLRFFAYCVAHEAHHRAQIEIALRINGHEPDDKFLYGLWEWSKK